MNRQPTLALYPFVYVAGRLRPVMANLPPGVISALQAALYERFGLDCQKADEEAHTAVVRFVSPEASDAEIASEVADFYAWEVRAPRWPSVVAACAAQEGQQQAASHLAPITDALIEHGADSAALLIFEYL